ncbi:hypothetical protein [Flavihumibacter sp. CACIAM 22H1]|uniref:hypothetical protein n=1 Tax=Flavihumibacter sp. CACIAM 22H1 TaxID=1812911 RepID=UPI0007A802B5|nr:hypothetical protein [Flavihumibacter sp. CACIAM 22H1]KYP13472.1 MAG: hypothetical protein A1D16_12300 [Flavihumibacter sp. CACIAM 22H1]
MRLSASILSLLSCLLLSCGSSQKITSSWVNPQWPAASSYKTIFIAVLSSRQSVKSKIENELAAFVTAKGYTAIKSSEALRSGFTDDKMPDREAMLGKIRELKSDAIFTVALVDKESESRYVPGSMPYQPFIGYYGRGFWGYYNYWYPFGYNPGYYTTDKTYFLEGNLFDVKTEEQLWSVQTEAYNPTSIEKFSREYAQLLWKRAEKELPMKNTPHQ